MGNLESKIAEGEGKHTPAANNNKEINEIKIDLTAFFIFRSFLFVFFDASLV